MYRTLILVALLAYVLSIIGAACAPTWSAAPVRRVPVAIDNSQPIVGFAFSLHHVDDLGPYLRSVDEIADLGFNSIEIVTPAFQTDGGSSDVRRLEGNSAKREDILKLLDRAQRRGMRTSLMPIVLFTTPRGNEWRGKIAPDNWDQWWQNYNTVLDYFLDIAVDGKVNSFSVGSELLSTEKKTAEWKHVIARAREKLSGRRATLYYSTNWDHYDVPTFWQDLDAIGISSYWDITKGSGTEQPTREQLAKRWAEIRTEVLDFAQDQHRPVLFTEVGYPTLPWGMKDPWNYVNTRDAAPAPEIQAQGYASYLAAWGDLLGRTYRYPGTAPRPRQPRPVLVATTGPATPGASGIPGAGGPVAGVFFYSWEPYSNGGPDDTGYGIKGKPTYDLLKNWLAQPSEFATTRP